jgi:hypothetical protein
VDVTARRTDVSDQEFWLQMRIAMRVFPSLFLLPTVAAIGCGVEHDAPTPSADTTPIEYEHRSFHIVFASSSLSCDAASALLEGGAVYDDDGSPVPGATCHYTFSDGSTSDECVLEHDFGAGGIHPVSLDVTVPGVEGTAHLDADVHVYEPLVAALEVTAPECGLELSWAATINVLAEAHVFVEPGDKIITDDPLYHWNRSLSLPVTEPGTYTLRLTVEDERTSGPICTAEVVKQVTVVACSEEPPAEDPPAEDPPAEDCPLTGH